jgi:hypothetical protein
MARAAPALRGFWLRLSGTLVCLLVLPLPYRPRFVVARLLNYVANPPAATAGLFFQRWLRLWNRLVLAFVFFLGFPFAKLILLLRPGRVGPRAGAPTYWVPRPPPEEFAAGMKDPF